MLYSNRVMNWIAQKVSSRVNGCNHNAIISHPTKSYLFAKRIMDIVLAVIFLILTFPTLLLISIFVKISSKGPAIIKVERYGKNHAKYYSYKFKTMTKTPQNEEPANSQLSKLILTNLGYFLWRTGLNELPSLINVLLGDISLVGRSFVVDYLITNGKVTGNEIEKLINLKPGMLSLWMLSLDRQKIDSERIICFDIYYYNNCSLLLDLKIIVCSVIILSGTVSKY